MASLVSSGVALSSVRHCRPLPPRPHLTIRRWPYVRSVLHSNRTHFWCGQPQLAPSISTALHWQPLGHTPRLPLSIVHWHVLSPGEASGESKCDSIKRPRWNTWSRPQVIPRVLILLDHKEACAGMEATDASSLPHTAPCHLQISSPNRI